MYKYVIIVILFISSLCSINAQAYKKHTVKVGETVSDIAKIYNVTESDIYALNPDAKIKLQPYSVLIIPFTKLSEIPEQEDDKELLGYKFHKVKRKETLYSLSKFYNVPQEEIKKANPILYSENLKKGQKIKIPNYKTIINKTTKRNTIAKYIVLPKEGKWRVAYKYGISVKDLEDLNPDIKEILQPGDTLNVPNLELINQKQIDSSFSYYEVLPKEGFYRLKIKTGLTQEELEALNPELLNGGLKDGMVLKLPKKSTSDSIPNIKNYKILKDQLNSFTTKKIALLMPYRINKLEVDSVEYVKSKLKEGKLLSKVTDYHIGFTMALDSAKSLGISSDIKIIDSEYSSSKIREILEENNNFQEYDAVIGPMHKEGFDITAKTLQEYNIPVIAALNKPKNSYNNVYQTIPNNKLLQNLIINEVKSDTINKQIVIIADRSKLEKCNTLKEHFPKAKIIYSRMDKKEKTKDAYFIYPLDLQNVFIDGRNYVFVETDNAPFVSSLVSMLNGLVTNEKEIILTTTNKNKAFENRSIGNKSLSNLKFQYASVNRFFDYEVDNLFVSSYKKIYGVSPSKYTIRGFDITFDILLRLAAFDSMSNSTISEPYVTEYIENKFQYQSTENGGFINNAAYVVKHRNLKIIEAKE